MALFALNTRDKERAEPARECVRGAMHSCGSPHSAGAKWFHAAMATETRVIIITGSKARRNTVV